MEDRVLSIKDTTATKKIFQLKKRIRAVSGGTSASKTISILIWCIDYAQSTRGELISVVSETFPHLSGGAMLDFERIMRDRGYWQESRWVRSPKPTYTFETGTRIEFISVDTVGKAHGPRRDVLFINEANNLSFEIVDQLIVRTRKIVWMDWNPVSEFWFYTEMMGKREDIDFIKLTYKDNEALNAETIKEIESRKHKKGWWKVYGEGELGEAEGRIFTGWEVIDEIPHGARLERHWLDFGYTNDPTAIGDLYYYNGGYILDEQVYQKGLSNKQIADILLNLGKAITIADSAEPKSIDEIRLHGITIMPAVKGPDSKIHGIQMMQDQKISVTKRSVNLLKEYRNYLWMIDKDGRTLNEPEGIWDHHMDGIRYAMSSLIPFHQIQDIYDNMPRLYREPKKNKAR
jgi:phage terminase large subunit